MERLEIGEWAKKELEKIKAQNGIKTDDELIIKMLFKMERQKVIIEAIKIQLEEQEQEIIRYIKKEEYKEIVNKKYEEGIGTKETLDKYAKYALEQLLTKIRKKIKLLEKI